MAVDSISKNRFFSPRTYEKLIEIKNIAIIHAIAITCLFAVQKIPNYPLKLALSLLIITQETASLYFLMHRFFSRPKPTNTPPPSTKPPLTSTTLLSKPLNKPETAPRQEPPPALPLEAMPPTPNTSPAPPPETIASSPKAQANAAPDPTQIEKKPQEKENPFFVPEEQIDIIRDIFKTTAEKNYFELMREKQNLENVLTPKVMHLHPMTTLFILFSDPKLKNYLKTILKKGYANQFRRNGFLFGTMSQHEGCVQRLNNATEFHIDYFCDKLKLDIKIIEPLIQNQKWEEFIDKALEMLVAK